MSNYQVIARKWRPQTFKDLVGQEHVTETLKNAIAKDRVAHAYIFSGARGVGKTTAARILAKALNCVHGPTAEPCGVCDACKEIASGNSLDVIEIDAASNRGIDQIRELREMVRYAPAASRHKVVILDEAHMLTTEASNALLKTLEEPPDRVIFVMATTEPENLEDTIRSRSQHFHFRALTFAEIAGRIEHIAREENLKIEPGALAVIARMAEGSLRDALSLLEQARAYCGDTIPDKEVRELLGVVPEDALEEFVNAIAEGSADRALGLVHRFQKDGRNLQHFCREAIRHIRNLLIARVSGADSELIAATADQRPGLARAAALFSEEDLTRFFQILLQTDDSLRRAPDPRVHLEMGLLRLINAGRLAPLEELMAELKGSGGAGSSGAGPSGASKTGAVAAATRGAAFSSLAPEQTLTPQSFVASGAVPEKIAFAATAPEVADSDAGTWRPDNIGVAAKKTDASRVAASANTANNSAAVAPAVLQKDVRVAAEFVPGEFAAVELAANLEDEPTPELEIQKRQDAALKGGAIRTAAKLESASVETAKPELIAQDVEAGISDAQVAEIKAIVQDEKKFVGGLLEQSGRWQVEGAELRIFFPAEKRAFAELLEARESLEKIRSVVGKVLGRPVRVCAKIESMAAAAAGAGGSRGTNGSAGQNSARQSESDPDLRARFERDPMVRSMMDRFGGRISQVKRADS
jgi:DNA polymerase III subunit gamma/tau